MIVGASGGLTEIVTLPVSEFPPSAVALYMKLALSVPNWPSGGRYVTTRSFVGSRVSVPPMPAATSGICKVLLNPPDTTNVMGNPDDLNGTVTR